MNGVSLISDVLQCPHTVKSLKESVNGLERDKLAVRTPQLPSKFLVLGEGVLGFSTEEFLTTTKVSRCL